MEASFLSQPPARAKAWANNAGVSTSGQCVRIPPAPQRLVQAQLVQQLRLAQVDDFDLGLVQVALGVELL